MDDKTIVRPGEKPKPQIVRLPEVDVYCGGQSHPFRNGEPHYLPAEHALDLRERGLRVDFAPFTEPEPAAAPADHAHA